MIGRQDSGQPLSIQPTAFNFQDVDTLFPALVQHPAENGPKYLFGAVNGLEINETSTFQSQDEVVLSIENRICDEAGALGRRQDPGAPSRQ